MNGEIVASWDAKYGKANLRDEIEEMDTKFYANTPPNIFGFVTSVDPELTLEIKKRRDEVSLKHSVDISIACFEDWISQQVDSALALGISEEELSAHWIRAFSESLAQRRREMAPIDEPCLDWLKTLQAQLEKL